MEDMDSADTGNTVNCSICTAHKEPVTLKCGLYFCCDCIGKVLGAHEASEIFSRSECTSEQVDQPTLLRNIVEKYRSSQSQQVEVQIFCTNCLSSAVPAVKTCLHCEVCLCENHLKVHSMSAEHVLVEPTTSLENRKCSVHKELLKYYCSEDSTCICVSCCLIGKHKGHEVESLIEASNKKKSKLRCILKMLISKRELIMKRVENLQEHKKDTLQKGVCLSKRILTLIEDIRGQLNAMEKTILNDLSKQEDQVVHSADALIKQLELKDEEHYQQMVHIEKLCSMNDPFNILLQEIGIAGLYDDNVEVDEEYEEGGSAYEHVEEEEECDVDSDQEFEEEEKCNVDTKIANDFTGEGDEHDQEEEENFDEDGEDYNEEEETDEEDLDDEDYEMEEDLVEEEEEMASDGDSDDECYAEDKDTVGILDEDLVAKSLQGGLAEIMHSVKGGFYAQKASEIVLDLNTAASNIAICKDLKTATCSFGQHYPETPERFAFWQVLSSTCFSSGRHYWKVEASKSARWSIGIAYASIDRKGCYYSIGYNNKSWCLSSWNSEYLAVNDSKETMLPFKISCLQFGVYLDYEEGRLSFYELSNPAKHLHTFTTTFTEPLHAAFYVWCDWVKIIS